MSTADILARVQQAPDISTDNAAYVGGLITKAQAAIARTCNFPGYQFPILSQGYLQSGASPSTDISALTTNAFWLSVNGGDFVEINPTLANCTSGAATAAELQAQIRAAYTVADYRWDSVAVAYSSSLYTITSPTYGEQSSIRVRFPTDQYHVVAALKLSPLYGGKEVQGTADNDALDELCAQVVIDCYRGVKIVPENYEGTDFAALVDHAMAAAMQQNMPQIRGYRRLR